MKNKWTKPELLKYLQCVAAHTHIGQLGSVQIICIEVLVLGSVLWVLVVDSGLNATTTLVTQLLPPVRYHLDPLYKYQRGGGHNVIFLRI